ncbi:DUF4287 domain-containing protein [Glaciibacter sp. 2TAF33]|uniref:DUF4287 domain-containing protein n=1 Tax=Glaciibacter sp. 2TAF33 TaxID=3233015 RepID=UPI003F922F31
MAARTVTSRTDGMSDDALTDATGKGWAEWFALLDATDATTWTHPQIAAWLYTEHQVPRWWCQTVTVGFEQARGMRLPGQRADGTFEVSTSATLSADQPGALDAVVAVVTDALGAPASENREAKYATARWKLDGRESLLVTSNPANGGKTSVSLTHQRMSTPEQVAPAKAAMVLWLAAARDRCSGLG